MSKQSIKIKIFIYKEKKYSGSDNSKDNSDKDEKNTSNSEIKEEVHEEDVRNEEDSSNEI